MNTKLYSQTGEEIGSIDLPGSIFDVAMNEDLVHQVVQAQIANARVTIAHTKGRGEVRGGGKKPWRQKGTGRARHASIRSPIWKGGGVAFGPTKERNFSRGINKTMARKALAMVFSAKNRDGELLMLDNVNFPEPKTAIAAKMLKKFAKPRDSVLIVTPDKNILVERAVRNLPRAGATAANSVNVRDILACKRLIMAQESIPVIQKTFHL